MKPSLRILIVDDSSAMRAFIRAALEDGEPCEVREASNGFEALQRMARDTFELFVLDINMPDINGLELISFIRSSEIHKQTPVLIVSTEATSRDRDRALSLGADAYLGKPFEPQTLRDLVTTLHSRARGNEAAG